MLLRSFRDKAMSAVHAINQCRREVRDGGAAGQGEQSLEAVSVSSRDRSEDERRVPEELRPIEEMQRTIEQAKAREIGVQWCPSQEIPRGPVVIQAVRYSLR